jgi:hypothetical protein
VAIVGVAAMLVLLMARKLKCTKEVASWGTIFIVNPMKIRQMVLNAYNS